MKQISMLKTEPVRLTAIPLAGFKAGAGGKAIALFTREMGQLRVFARRSGKKSKSLPFSPFSTYRILARPKVGDKDSKGLPELREFQPERIRSRLGEGVDLGAWATACVLAELLLDTTATGDPHPYLYDMLEEALDRLEEGAAGADLLIAFILKFLEHTGYKPRLEPEGTPKKSYAFDVASGGIRSPEEAGGGEAIAPSPGTRFSLAARELEKLENLRVARFSALTETCLSAKEADRLLDLLAAYVEYHYEVRLKSFSVWREMNLK